MPSERYRHYIKQCALHHKTSKTFSGNGCLKHASEIITMAREVNALTALDYGCGKGNQYAREFEFDGKTADLQGHLGFLVDKWDPAVKQFAGTKLDHMRDLVWCTDVMEHIPEEDIEFVAGELVRLARKALFVTVATYPAKKNLPNGENAHVTVKPVEWWQDRFEGAVHERMRNQPDFKFQMLVA
jgi:hypothetical protein